MYADLKLGGDCVRNLKVVGVIWTFFFFVESYVSHVEMEKPKYIKVRVV